ncbi:MAG: tetratricopeptide repeat protein [Elusimicrobiota bacterium]
MNPSIRSLGWANLSWMVLTLHNNTYQPLSWMLLGCIVLVQGLKPFGFHLVSWLLHAANAAVYCLVAAKLLGWPDGKEGRRSFDTALCALVAALLFACHPLQVESVALAAGLGDLLSAFFFLLSILAYLRGKDPRGVSSGESWPWLSWALFLASGLSRWKGFALPAVLLLLDFYPLGRLRPDPRSWFEAAYRRVWQEKIPYLAVAAGILLVNVLAKTTHPGSALSMNPAAFFGAATLYLGKWLAPFPLYPVYAVASPYGLRWPLAVSAGMVLAVTAGLGLCSRRWPAGLLVWLYFLINVAPIVAVPIDGWCFAADRHAYLACLGFPLLVAGACLRGCRSWSLRRSIPGLAPLAAVGVVLFFFCRLVVGQIAVWRDSHTLWRHVLEHDPGSRYGHFRQGLAFLDENRFAEALASFRLQLRAEPRVAMINLANAYNKWGVLLYQQGRIGEAAARFKESVAWGPSFQEGHRNLAAALHRQGRNDEAIAAYKKALLLGPANADAHADLGLALAECGASSEARAQLEAALRISPSHGQAVKTLNELDVIRRRQFARSHCGNILPAKDGGPRASP